MLDNSKFILGTAQLGSRYGIKHKTKNRLTSKKILKIAKKRIQYLDLADSYVESKKILKEIDLNNWKLCYKISNRQLRKVKIFFFNALKKYNVKKFEYFLFHNVKSLYTKEGKKAYKILKNLKKKGYIKKLGVSLYTPEELKRITKLYKIDIIQIPLNIFDQRFLSNNLLGQIKKKKIEIHVRSIFLQGLLTVSSKKLTKKFNKFKDIVIKWENFVKKLNSSKIKECIKFISSIKKIDKVVIGVDSPKELNQILSIPPVASQNIYSKLKCSDINLTDPRRW